jgi:hypothetical protein
VNALAPPDLGRLAKICGLFSSDHVGERAAAAARADRIVRDAGLTWSEILKADNPRETASEPPSRRRDNPMSPSEILACRNSSRLTDWERRFLSTLAARRSRWTDRQYEVFEEIRKSVSEANA